MQAPPDTSTKKVGFFQLSLTILQRIVQSGGGYNDLAAYFVLCGGVNGREVDRYCTHGAKSISVRTGLTVRAATKSIEWLHAQNFIRLPYNNEPKFLGNAATRGNTVRCVLNDAEYLDVAISKHFIDGVTKPTKDTPLQSLMDMVDGADEITRPQAVKDALLLYAAMLKEQDFGDCAGADPEVWHQCFVPIEPGEDGDGTQHIGSFPDSDWVLVTVKASLDQNPVGPFVRKVFGETPADPVCMAPLSARFMHAMRQLWSARLLYRVLVLWGGNPLDAAQRGNCEPVATQYIADEWARQIDLHVQYVVHSALWRTETRDAAADFNEAAATGDLPFLYSGRYRYIVKAGAENRVTLVGQLRVRHWPANNETAIGRERERRRTEKYQRLLDLLVR